MSPWRLRWFDLTRGAPSAVGALKREMGWFTTLRVLGRFTWRRLWRRPFRELTRTRPLSAAERFTRHQLLPVLHLDDVLQQDMGYEPDRAQEILSEVVGSSGARFIRYATGIKSPQSWTEKSEEERLSTARGSIKSFLNAEVQEIQDPGSSFAFNVTRCHFVELCHQLDRPYLASLFCRADEILFGDPGFGVQLDRAQTLASGASTCTFRLSWGNVSAPSLPLEDEHEE